MTSINLQDLAIQMAKKEVITRITKEKLKEDFDDFLSQQLERYGEADMVVDFRQDVDSQKPQPMELCIKWGRFGWDQKWNEAGMSISLATYNRHGIKGFYYSENVEIGVNMATLEMRVME